MHGCWAGTDAWLLSPSEDHYHCNLYYIPETRTYWVSGSAKLFPQHCQVPNLSNTAHLKALTKELAMSTGEAVKTHKGRALICQLKTAIKGILALPVNGKQRVVALPIGAPSIPNNTQVPITRILEAPAIMQTRDPMAKQNLITTKCLHRRLTRNNTPGAVLTIKRTNTPTMIPLDKLMPTARSRSTPVITSPTSPMMTFTPLPGGVQASARLVSQQALHAMTIKEAVYAPDVFTPKNITRKSYKSMIPN
jgi:hypothetical protein